MRSLYEIYPDMEDEIDELELETDESQFRSVSGNILWDPDYLLAKFRELPGMARRLD